MFRKLPKLPSPVSGKRRIWNQETETWFYAPVLFPDGYNSKKLWLLWNHEKDVWEMVDKKTGKHIRIEKTNHVKTNLRLRANSLYKYN